MMFFTGCNHPYLLSRYRQENVPVMISVNGLLKKYGNTYHIRKSPIDPGDWIMDSGAFSRISRKYGFKGHLSVKKYARIIKQFSTCGNCLAVVSQDWMCEEFILSVTGLDIPTHQKLTIKRYDLLKKELGETFSIPIMPVLQGYEPEEYVSHLHEYGDRIKYEMWVGVGSVCKRNTSPELIRSVLRKIKQARPDLRLHGFGLKKTALCLAGIRNMLFSADSQAGGLYDGDGKNNKYDHSNDIEHLLKYHRLMSSNIQTELDFMYV